MDHILTGKYTANLICSYLKGTMPQNKPEEITFEDIYRMSRFHNVSVMTLKALKKTDQVIEPELLKKWKQKAELSAAQAAIQLLERRNIYETFEQNGIDYLPLKGCILKDFYPESDDREMADLDILVREDNADAVRTALEGIGYTCEKFRQRVHDSYTKKPFVHIEIHYRLFSEVHFDKYGWKGTETEFFLEPWNQALQTEGTHQYHFCDDNLYFYMIMHLAKHYLGSGTGIRQLIDLHYLNQNLVINKEHVYEMLDHYNLRDFCVTAENLVSYWFGDYEGDEAVNKLEQEVFQSGSYGTQDRGFQKAIDKYAKEHPGRAFLPHYIADRLFPSLHEMQETHPGLRKHPALLPAYWTGRILVKGTKAVPKKIRELKKLRKIIKENKQTE